ncbi:hypothetical protein ACHAXT_012086 [Thalassiosira profunda]
MSWTRRNLPPTPDDSAPGGGGGEDTGPSRDVNVSRGGIDEPSCRCAFYGPGELESHRHARLRCDVARAKLKVWYPGRWRRPSPRARFRTRLEGACIRRTREEGGDAVLLRFRSNARIVSAELLNYNDSDGDGGKECNEADAQTNRERYLLRWQSTVECICNERVYDHAILLSCKHISSEFVPGATSSHALLLELNTRLASDSIDATKSDGDSGEESETAPLPDPPPCIVLQSTSDAQEWEWRDDDIEEWTPIRSCWTSRSDVRSNAPCPFPHQMELSQTLTVRPARELPSNADADEESPNTPNTVIYDFGRELLGKVCISIPKQSTSDGSTPAVEVRVGESSEEARNDEGEHFEQCLDLSYSLEAGAPVGCASGEENVSNDATNTSPPNDNQRHAWVSCHLLAFRYVRVIIACNGHVDVDVTCQQQLPLLEERGSFSCGEPNGNDERNLDQEIWHCAKYTLQLCIHENFIVDGIKRDRLPWVGDLAVSLMANAYSFCDRECVRWTLSVLGRCGLDRLGSLDSIDTGENTAEMREAIAESHINGCVDYTLWFFICHCLYQRYSVGDVGFLQQEWRLLERRLRCLLRCCDQEEGWLVIGDKEWVFVDWNVEEDGDKSTPVQVLWWYSLQCGISLAQKMAGTSKGSTYDILALLSDTQLKLENAYLRKDDIQDGFSRHAHILGSLSGLYARLDDRASDGEWYKSDTTDDKWQTRRRCRDLFNRSKQALLGDALPPVATPYMKHLEALAISRLGERISALDSVRSYWGGMLDRNATTFFEAFNENESSADIAQFYDRPFARSLCHAWASGPCALYPEILLGLRPLSDGWGRWFCDPLERVSSASATIQTKFGLISVQLDEHNLEVDVPSGTAMTLMEKSYSSGRHTIPRKSLISSHAVHSWSQKYRGWHHHPTHVIKPGPAIPGYDNIQMTDVPTVYQLPDDEKYYMSFIGFDGEGYQTFIAESDNLFEWSNIRLAMGYGPGGSFDHGGVVLGAYLMQDYAVDAEKTLKRIDGRFYSLYGAYAKKGTYEPDPGAQGLASSEDGITWKRENDESILSIYGPGVVGEWESASIYQPWLVEHEGTYYNFYNAKKMPEWIEQIGLATSNDLHNWTRHEENPVLRVGRRTDAALNDGYNTQFASDAKVFYDPECSAWVMFYFGVGKGGAHIMIAFSKDLIHWVRDPTPLYTAGANPSGLDKEYAHKISLVCQDETWYLFYCAVGDAGRGIGLITSRPLSK